MSVWNFKNSPEILFQCHRFLSYAACKFAWNKSGGQIVACKLALTNLILSTAKAQNQIVKGQFTCYSLSARFALSKVQPKLMGGLMVSAPDSGLSSPGSSLARVIVLCSWARHFTLIVPLSTQVYKWVPANKCWGVTLRWSSIPSRGMPLLLIDMS